MSSNRSAFLDGQDKPLRVGESTIPTPGANDIIVRNRAVAVNTIDPAQAGGFQVKKYEFEHGQSPFHSLMVLG